jgi:pimeloyl-ACP methyl ester carboxylesterase
MIDRSDRTDVRTASRSGEGPVPTTQVGPRTIYYDDSGTGHPLLLLSGLGASRLGWWKQVGPLSRSYRVVNMDNRDAGQSAPGTGPYSIADMADDAAGVIMNLGLSPAHVMGISMGGFIAQELALRHPALLEKLILVATAAGGASYVRPAPEIAALLGLVDRENIETRVRRTFPRLVGPGYMQRHPEDLDQIVRNAEVTPMSPEGYGRQIGAVMLHVRNGTLDRLSQIKMPTLVVHGDHDPLVPYANGEYIAAHVSGARLSTYAGVGHLPSIEAAERFNREVFEFLGE